MSQEQQELREAQFAMERSTELEGIQISSDEPELVS